MTKPVGLRGWEFLELSERSGYDGVIHGVFQVVFCRHGMIP
jgi:hypothetical protein